MARKRQAGPFRVAFGGEGFLIDRFLDVGRRWEGRSIIELNGSDIDGDDLVDECETLSFDGSPRVIIVDNAQTLSGDALDEYIERTSPKDDSVVIIAGVRSDKLNKTWKKAVEKGISVACPKFKPWETDKQVERIEAEAKRLGLKLDKRVPETLLLCLGDDLRALVNELEKLTYLVKEGELVKREHVAKVVTQVFPVQPWDVAEVAAAKNAKKAMTLLSLLFKHFGEAVCVPVTASLMKTVERLIIARQLTDQGEPTAMIAARLSMHEYAYKVNLMPLVQKHTVSKLREEMARLCCLETQVKGPARSKRTHVELAVLSLAA